MTDQKCFIIYLMNQAFMCGAMNVTTYVEPMWGKTILIYVFTLTASVLLQIVSDQVLKAIYSKKAPKEQDA